MAGRLKLVVRRLLTGLLGLSLAFCLFGAVAFFSEPGQRALRQLVRGALHDQYGLQLSYDRLQPGLFPPGLALWGLEVNGRDGQPFLSLRRATVRIDLWALVQGRVVIDSLDLAEPHVRLVFNHQGELLNLPEWSSPSGEAASREEGPASGEGGGGFWLRTAQLRDGAVELLLLDGDQAAPGQGVPGDSLRLRGIDVDVEGPAPNEVQVSLVLGDGLLQFANENYPLEHLEVQGAYRDDAVFVEQARLGLAGASLNIRQGELALVPPHDVSLNIAVDLPLALVNRLPQELPHLGGRASLRADVTRRDGQLSGGGTIEGRGLHVRLGQDAPPNPGSGLLSIASPLSQLNVDLPFELRGRAVQIDQGRIFLSGPNTEGQLRFSAMLDWGSAHRPFQGTLEFDGFPVQPVADALGVPRLPFGASLGGAVVLSGQLSPWALRVELRPLAALGLSVVPTGTELPAGPAVERVELHGQLSMSDLGAELIGLRLRLGALASGQHLELSGFIPWAADGELALDVESSTAGLGLEPLAPLAGVSLGGRLTLQGRVEGSPARPRAQGTVSATRLVAAGRRVERLSATVDYDQSVVTISAVKVRAGRSRLRLPRMVVDLAGQQGPRAEGTVELAPLHLEDVVTLAGVTAQAGDLRGLVRGRVELSFGGTTESLVAAAEARFADLSWAGASLGSGTFSGTWRGDHLLVERLAIRRAGGQLSLRGTVQPESGEVDLVLTLRQLQLPSLAELGAGLPRVTAQLDGQATVTGTFAEPRGEGHLVVSGLEIEDHRWPPSELNWELGGDHVELRGQLAGGLLELTEARVGLASPFPFQARGGGQVARLHRLALPLGLPPELDGQASLSFGLTGELAQLPASLAGQVDVQQLALRYGERTIGSEPFRLTLGRGELALADATFGLAMVANGEGAIPVSASAPSPGARVRIVAMSLGLAQPWPVRLRAQGQIVDWQRLMGPQNGPELDLQGTLSLGAHGALAQPRQLRAVATVRGLEVRHGDLTAAPSAPVRLTYQAERIELAPLQLVMQSPGDSRGSSFHLGGWLTPDRLNLTARGQLDLSPFAALVDGVDQLGGRVDVDCRVGGSPAEPRVAGTLQLTGGLVAAPSLPQPLSNARGVVNFDQQVISLDQFSALVLGGRAEGRGVLRLAGASVGSYRFDLQLVDARLPVAAESPLVFNAALGLRSPAGDDELPLLTGLVDVVRFRYEAPVNLGLNLRSLLEGVRRRRRPPPPNFDPSDAALRFDIRVDESGPMIIDNNVMEGRVHLDRAGGAFRMVGNNLSPALLGSVRVAERSTVRFRNTEFEVQRGVLSFRSAQVIEADLDVVATTRRRDWDITLRVTGNSRQPRVELSSLPPLDESDILLVLTIGLTQAETDGDQAGALLADLLSRGFNERLQRALPVFDEVRITSDYSSRTGRVEPQVFVGRRLSKNLRLGATAAVSASRDFEATANYSVTDTISVEAVYQDDRASQIGNVGGDIIFRREFRGICP
jgi:hypothetical protein